MNGLLKRFVVPPSGGPSEENRLKVELRTSSHTFSSSGFTILEILVALLVFAIGVTGMLTALGHHMKDVSLTEDHARGVRIAQREMNALRRLQYLPDEEMTGEEGRYVWTTTVEEADLDELPGMNADEAGSSRALKPYTMNILVQWSDVEGGELKRRIRLDGMELFQGR